MVVKVGVGLSIDSNGVLSSDGSSSADVEDLKSTVTINIGQYLDVVDKAAKNAEAVK